MALSGAKSVFNFCSGPAMLPSAVMQKAQSEFVNYQNLGVSIMEMSHRSETFQSVICAAESNLRKLLSVPKNYKVLFMQGGASLQFAAVPMNLMRTAQKAGFLDTGYWSKKAISEAKKFGSVDVVASTESSQYKAGLPQSDLNLQRDLSYLHYTPNETIDGAEFGYIPDSGEVPLVADMSSCILSAPIDVSKFGLIYAGAQKNIGPAGLAVVIVRDDLIGHASEQTPRLLNYQEVVDQNSLANTPPTYAIYLANLVFQWLLDLGGLSAIAKINKEKSECLYRAIDDSSLFYNDVELSIRSKMNVPIFMKNISLMDNFITEAEAAGLMNLLGHRSRGGLRASIYNAMPIEGVKALVEFIKIFENKYV